MKKIEILLVKFCQFLNKNCPNYFTLFLFIFCVTTALIINKYRKKDKEDIEEQKAFDNFFNNVRRYISVADFENENFKQKQNYVRK